MVLPSVAKKSGKTNLTDIKNENENETEKKAGEATHGGALRAPLAGSPAFVSVFVFVSISV